MPDYKTFLADRPFRRYYNSGKYFAKRDYKWLNISDGDIYPTAHTLVKMDTSNFAAGATVGTITATYYIGARGYTP